MLTPAAAPRQLPQATDLRFDEPCCERSKRPISALIGNSTEFPILRQQTFLDHAATSPLCAAAARAQANHVHRATMEPPSWPRLAPAVAAVRSTCADLIGANPLEIAFVKNTSEGLSTAAFGLNWRKEIGLW